MGNSRGAPVRRVGPVRFVAAVAFANGLVIAAQAFSLRGAWPIREAAGVLPLGVSHWSRAGSVGLGFLLVALSFYLYRRRRLAWIAALAVAALAAAAHLLSGPSRPAAIPPLVLAAVLLFARRSFPVRVPARSVAWGAAVFGASVLFAVGYGALGFWFLDRRDFGVEFHAADALVRALRAYVLAGNPDLVPRTREARWFLDSLGLLGAVAVPVGVYALFRPAAYRLRTLPHERARARAILEAHGRTPDDYFKLLPDKSYFFANGGEAFVAYRVTWGVALALGDPGGPAERIGGAAREFAAFCERNGWDVAFHHTLPEFQPVYRDLGFESVKIGEEALVDLDRFASSTADTKDFRHVRGRLEKQGYAGERCRPPHPAGLFDELEEVSREWLSLPGRRERNFALGRFDREYLAGTPVFTVRGPDGRLIAFANEIPCFAEGEAAVDLMRHRREIPNGAMDFLFLRLLLALHDEGIKTFSLGLAPLAGVGEDPGASLQERAMHEIYVRLNRVFSFRGLRKYKSKFEPRWRDAFLVYRGGPIGLLRVGLSLNRAAEE